MDLGRRVRRRREEEEERDRVGGAATIMGLLKSSGDGRSEFCARFHVCGQRSARRRESSLVGD